MEQAAGAAQGPGATGLGMATLQDIMRLVRKV
jgi:hypothetical protein